MSENTFPTAEWLRRMADAEDRCGSVACGATEMTGDFYAVFVNSSVHIPGDDRSRQAPGHGYPAHDHKYIEVIEFKTLEDLKGWVERQSRYGQSNFRAVKCSPLAVSLKAIVEVEHRL